MRYPIAQWAASAMKMAEDYEELPEEQFLRSCARRFLALSYIDGLSSDSPGDVGLGGIPMPMMNITPTQWYKEAKEFSLRYVAKPEQQMLASIARQFHLIHLELPEPEPEFEEDPIGHMVVGGDLDDID